MGRHRWTAEQDALLRDSYLKGEPVDRLAQRFDTSQANVRQRLSRLDVRRPAIVADRGKPPRMLKPPDDIATRLAILLDPEPRPEATRREFTDAQLLRFVGQDVPPGGPGGPQGEGLALVKGLNRTAPRSAPGGLARYVVDSPPLTPDPAMLARLAGLDAY